VLGHVLFGIIICLQLAMPVDGQDWQHLGPPGGMVLALGAGSDGAVYLGTADGHVFVKEDPTKPWELRGRVGTRTDTVISRLLVNPVKPESLFAAVWYQQPGAGGGVFRSIDGARTWTLVGLQQEAVRALETAGEEPGTLVAGTRNGVFRSVDSGKSWQRISPEGDPELRNLDSLAVDPRDANVIYAGTYHLPWKTTDGGKNWQPVTAGLIDDSDIMGLRVDAGNPDRLFLSACSGIYRSENQGGLWTKLQGIPYAARRTQAIVQDAGDPRTLYAATTEGLWVTRDSGESWERTTPADWVIDSMAVAHGGADAKERVVIGTEAHGVLVSQDAGKTMRKDNDGFNHQVVRQLIGDSGRAAHLLMLMDRDIDSDKDGNSVREGAILWESGDGGRQWTALPRSAQGTKGEPQFAPEKIQRVYASPWGWLIQLFTGRLWILDERNEKWTDWKLRLPVGATSSAGDPRRSTPRTQEKTASALEPALPDGRILEFSERDAYVSTREGLLRCNQEGRCARLKSFGRESPFRALQVSANGSKLTAVLDGKLATSVDGGQTASWADLPVSANSALWVDDFEQQGKASLFLGTVEGLFASGDGGTTWRRCEQGLPPGQVERLLHAHGFLAASLREGGLYVSVDDGRTWTRQDRDAERARFTGFVETAPGILTIGSQSEGVLLWRFEPKQK
jgi:photosystem II stability/assembly factor-like uncharacterized protein